MFRLFVMCVHVCMYVCVCVCVCVCVYMCVCVSTTGFLSGGGGGICPPLALACPLLGILFCQ